MSPAQSQASAYRSRNICFCFCFWYDSLTGFHCSVVNKHVSSVPFDFTFSYVIVHSLAEFWAGSSAVKLFQICAWWNVLPSATVFELIRFILEVHAFSPNRKSDLNLRHYFQTDPYGSHSLLSIGCGRCVLLQWQLWRRYCELQFQVVLNWDIHTVLRRRISACLAVAPPVCRRCREPTRF